MKIQLLIALTDTTYSEHLSKVLTEKYADRFEISLCSSAERLLDATTKRRYDILLTDPDMPSLSFVQNIRLTVLLCDGSESTTEPLGGMRVISKYQRISRIIGQLLEYCAETSPTRGSIDRKRGSVTVVWSPAGGSGKTTVALAYAANAASSGKKAVYLNLENFSSIPVYFAPAAKSISSVFSKLDSNVELLLHSIRMKDNGSGIYYFGQPENYDDINELTEEDLILLTENCAEGMDEVVIDLSSGCSQKTKKLFEIADQILLVSDSSPAGKAKWEQFTTQNNIYSEIRSRSTLVLNRTGNAGQSADIRTISLPVVQSSDPIVVYKTLSAGYWM